MVRLLSPKPEADPRVRMEARSAIEAQRLWLMRPVDALAARLRVTWDDETRREVDGLLRRPPAGPHAWETALERVRTLAPEATRSEVRRATEREAARAQRGPRTDWGYHAAGLFAAVRRTIEQAKLDAERESLLAESGALTQGGEI